MALSHIRAKSINNIDEPTLNAQTCALWYPICRDLMLSAANFQFSTKIRTLAALSVVVPDFEYTYQYPSDTIHINRVMRPGEERTVSNKVWYQVFNVNSVKVIATHEPDLLMEHRVRVTDLNLYDVNAIKALSHLLASNIVTDIIGGEFAAGMVKTHLQLYTMYAGQSATLAEAQQYKARKPSRFISIRN